MITGYYQRCVLSTYHFAIITELAWISSVCHLATLALLQDYLIEFRLLRNLRVIGMTCLLGLLAYGVVVRRDTGCPMSIPVQCCFRNQGFQSAQQSLRNNVLLTIGPSLGVSALEILSVGWSACSLLIVLRSPQSRTDPGSSAKVGAEEMSGPELCVLTSKFAELDDRLKQNGQAGQL